MRWMWIDRIVELVPRERLVAVKNVSLAEEHLHDHFPADPALGLERLPIMPACFIVEGMAQSAGILVGHAHGFREKVVLAKINRVELEVDASPGATLRYTATIDRMDEMGAATLGVIEMIEPKASGGPAPAREIGRIDLMFSNLDQNRAGLAFPEHNFVFGDSFRTLLQSSGFDAEF